MHPRSAPKPSLCSRGLRVLLACAALSMLPACATTTGTLTGWATGFVDLPAGTIEKAKLESDEPLTWMVVLVTAPIGLVAGPVFGCLKGIALDVHTLSGNLPMEEVWGSGGRASVWRPYTYGWNDK